MSNKTATLDGFIEYIKSNPDLLEQERKEFESNKSIRKKFSEKFSLDKLTIDDLLDGQGNESFIYRMKQDNLGFMGIKGTQPIIKKTEKGYEKNLIEPQNEYQLLTKEEETTICNELKDFVVEACKFEPNFNQLEASYFYRHRAFMSKLVCVYSEQNNYLNYNIYSKLDNYKKFSGLETDNPFELNYRIVKLVQSKLSDYNLNGIIINGLMQKYFNTFYKYALKYKDKYYLDNKAGSIFVTITKAVLKGNKLEVTDGEPTSTKVLGKTPKVDIKRFSEIKKGKQSYYLYTNLNTDDIKTKIEEFNNQLDDKVEFIRWDNDENVIKESSNDKEGEIMSISTITNKNLTTVNTILYGPPGTGKTYNSVIYAVKTIEPDFEGDYSEFIKKFNELKVSGQIAFTTFHQSYGYEEFIEGIKPKTEDGQVTYEVKSGIFKEFCKKAETDKENSYVFIIDEINRGNISKIFGELITLIEDSKREGAAEAMSVKLPYSGEEFSVPDNVYILGTMNTADRSIALMDTALRRRFEFAEMMPDSSTLQGIEVEEIDIKKMLDTMNKRIELLYDREHTLGHAFFMGLKEEPTIEKLASIFQNKIIPLLQEYFYEDYEKIMAVLGIKKGSNDAKKFISINSDNDEFVQQFGEVNETYQINNGTFFEPDKYQEIYGGQPKEVDGGNVEDDEE